MEVTVNNPKQYKQGFNGTALKVIFLKGLADAGGAVNPINVVARGNNFNWNVPMPVTQADEINVTSVQETNYGRQELGTGRIDVVFNLEASDQMPTAKTLRQEPELVILEVTGDDHPMTTLDASGNPVETVLNAFLGARIVNIASSDAVNQQKMMGVDVVFRQRLSGAEWKQLNSSAPYPASIKQ